jgi:TonB family protein
MSEMWKQWVGRTIDEKFPLQSYLGGSEHSAVFFTKGADSKNAAIKLIPAEWVNAEKQLTRWKAVRELSHPNLIRIFEAGRCELGGTKLLYVVEEYAEENLSQILPERALTSEEARGMLPPILRALQFVHEKGLVHGHIRPSNILAIGDQVKLSSDALGASGEKSGGGVATNSYDPPEAGTLSKPGDIWQLGVTLTEVLTQGLPVWDRSQPSAPDLPTTVPEPFREIVGKCLQVDPAKRWTVAQIADRLEGKRAVPTSAPTQTEKAASAPAVVSQSIMPQEKASPKWPYAVVLAVVVALAVFLIARPKSSSTPVESTQPQESMAGGNSQSAATSGTQGSANTDAASKSNQGDVVHRVVPEISPGARRTIHGKIMVRVKVKVDDAGDVETAKLESGRASKYFKRVALDAAQDWKFSPAQAGEQSGDREWKLQFGFSRAKTEASAVRLKK